MRKQDWTTAATVAAFVGAVLAAVRRRFRAALTLAAVGAGADVVGRIWSRREPAPIPPALRWVLRAPHPVRPLRSALRPGPGERILEVGPGLGQYAVRVAEWVGPDGHVDVLDVQQEMLDATMSRATQRGVTNITATLSDGGGAFPYPDASFDGAYLVSVLGEIPDEAFALSELRRVLRPGGRLVVGEIAIDPDFVSATRLEAGASAAGFRPDGRVGPSFGYCARFLV